MTEADRNEIAGLTAEYGGEWGINHTRRLLSIIDVIAEDREYDRDALWVAAHLHDWGGYPPHAEKGVNHALRSRQVAEEFLTAGGYPAGFAALVLECVEFHHSGDPDRSIESILLSDADALDFLGLVGMLRDFSKNPNDLKKAYETSKKRRQELPGLILLPKSREIAAERVRQMDELFRHFEKDTFGCF